MELLISLTIALGLNLVLLIPAYWFKTDKLTDIAYGLSFLIVALAVLMFSNIDLGKIILLVLITAWSLRLSVYLFIRINKIKKDKRFDGIRENFIKFGLFWALQGISVWIILIPSTIFLTQSSSQTNILSFIGLGVWAIGLLIEAMADQQKFTFLNNTNNQGQWIASGLWKYSRHPNYFGEITHWAGIYLFTFSTLPTWAQIIGAISPLYIAGLLIFISGLPKLEKQADQRWGSNPNYQNYKRKTSILIPLPPKK